MVVALPVLGAADAVLRFEGPPFEQGLLLADGDTVTPIVETGTIAPDTGTPFDSIRRWDAAGGIVAFEATPEGAGVSALYVWEAGKISLVARTGLALPGAGWPVVQLGHFDAGEDVLFFEVGLEDGWRLMARHDGRLSELWHDPPGYAHSYLYRHATDARQQLFEVKENGGRVDLPRHDPEPGPPHGGARGTCPPGGLPPGSGRPAAPRAQTCPPTGTEERRAAGLIP